MAEGALLLELMRKVRRRRRWTDATTGAALGVAVCAPAVAAAISLLRWRGVEPGVTGVVGVIVAGALGGALVRGVRRIPLAACARAVDRALGASSAGDRVFAAVAFAECGRGASPFVAALTADAWAQARALPSGRIVTGPPRRPLVLAGVGVVAVAALLASRVSPAEKRLATGVPAMDPALGASAGRPRTESLPRLRMTGAALEAEREDVAAARAAATAAADAELTRLADEMARLLAELSSTGVESESAVARARALASNARTAARDARRAAAAARAARAALAPEGRGTGAAATELANAIGSGEADGAAGRLASGGATGRTALARAAAAAAAALDAAAAGANAAGDAAADSGGAAQPGDDELNRRRLDDGSVAQAGGPPTAPPPGGANQRRLQKLRRDLERSAADCRRDPASCRRDAGNTGRSLDQLGQAGKTAEARSKLAQSAQQLLDRLQRGGGGAGDTQRARSFSRAARSGAAQGGGGPGTGAGTGTGPAMAMDVDRTGHGQGEGDNPGAGTETQPRLDGEAEGEAAGGDPGEHASDDERAQRAGGTTRSDQGAGAAAAGSGIGTGVGGPVMGTQTPGGAGTGRDAPTPVASAAQGPSRSAVIGGAASAGFASAGYRRVFTDYSTAVEESLDGAAVPPGRRYLVRRYFQLIRPRGP